VEHDREMSENYQLCLESFAKTWLLTIMTQMIRKWACFSCMGYHLCRKNAMVAVELYLQRYPNRRY
jgi:hypothetical protein